MTINRQLILKKLKATALHLGLSLMIFFPFLYLLVFKWFPGPLFFTDGGWQGLRLMLLCDVVLGPVLTFLVFNPKKTRRALGFDFTLIGLAQLGALIYGTHAVITQRPVAVAMSSGVFQAVLAESINKQEVTPEEWVRLGSGKPFWVYRREPKNQEERGGVISFAMVDNIGEEALVFLYEPLKENIAKLKEVQIDRAALIKDDPALAAQFQAIENAHSGELIWLRLGGRYADALIAFDQDLNRVDWIRRDLD